MPTLSGIVRSLNLSPKGSYESFLMDDGKRIVQINFSKGQVSNGLKPGQSITVNAEAYEDDRPSDHPVFSWIEQNKENYQGVVKQVNYALHGEPNGAILESGEFVHLHPDGARDLKLSVGQTLSVEGDAHTSPDGHIVIEARIVNGLALKHRGKKHKHDA